jgi:hypothetical protein
MSVVQQDILTAFYAKLSKSTEFDQRMIDALRNLLEPDKKVKADDIVALLVKGKHEGGL